MARNKEIKPYNEYRGSDRVFRVDRDTTIIYTGKDRSDIRPFIRVGAGKNPPIGLAGNVESVVLPEQEAWNVGLEMDWLDHSLQESPETLQYVGSKERVQLISRFIQKDEGGEGLPEDELSRLEMHPYEFKKSSASPRDRSVIDFMANGSFVVYVNGSRVYDYDAQKRSQFDLDKEYIAVEKILSRMKLEKSKGYGFIFPEITDDQQIPLYWMFAGVGLFMNPPQDHHYFFLDRKIPMDEMTMVLSGSPYTPGYVEAIRRKNVLKEEVGVYSPASGKNLILKKFFKNAKIQFFDDGRSLPHAREAIFNVSKTGSHGAFLVKILEHSETQLQIVFPLRRDRKTSKLFDYMGAPHDLEIAYMDSKKEFAEGVVSRMILHVPGNIKPTVYNRMNLEEGRYPLVPDSQYTFHQESKPGDFVELFKSNLSGTIYQEPISELFRLFASEEIQYETIIKTMREFLTVRVSRDLVERNNVHEALRYLKHTFIYNRVFEENDRRLLLRLINRHSIKSFQVRDWIALNQMGMSFSVLFFDGRDTFLLAKPDNSNLFRMAFPPEVGTPIEIRKEYRKYLKDVGRQIDKLNVPPAGARPTLEFVERVFDERERLEEERDRLSSLMMQLEVETEEEELGWFDSLIHQRWVPAGVREQIIRVQESLMNFKTPAYITQAYYAVDDFLSPVTDRVSPFFADLWDRLPEVGGNRRIWWMGPLAVLVLVLGGYLFFGGSSTSPAIEKGEKLEQVTPASETENPGENGDVQDVTPEGENGSQTAKKSWISSLFF